MIRRALGGISILIALFVGMSSMAMAQGVLYVNNNKVGIGVPLPEFLLHLVRADGGGAGFKVETQNAVANVNWFFQQNPVTGAFLITPFEGGFAPLQVFPGPGDLIQGTMVLRSGRVGIGTNAPVGKLDVNGAIYQRGAVLHADYVFDDEYQLESIDEHAKYMWEKKHLPAVGGATYSEDGTAYVELGQRSRAVLEELEKAHIYIDQLHSRLTTKEAELADMQGRLARIEERIAQ